MSARTSPKRTQPTFQLVEIGKLQFDPNNPRFGTSAKALDAKGVAAAQPAIQQKLEGAPHYALELIDSFVQNGFIVYEPLVVRESGDHFIVIEGNRRLAAARHIVTNKSGEFEQSLIESLSRIPVLVFHERADQSHIDEIRAYLGVHHLFGYREWPPESKARFLDAQIKTSSDLSRAVKELGVTKHTIRRYLVPFRVKSAAKKYLTGIDDQEFWFLGEALTRSGIAEFIDLDVDDQTLSVKGFDKANFEFLVDLLYGKPDRNGDRKRESAAITETRQISKLAIALSDDRATKELRKGKTLEEALLYVETTKQTVQRLTRLLSQTDAALRKLNSKKKSPEFESAIEAFEKFENAARALIKNVKANF